MFVVFAIYICAERKPVERNDRRRRVVQLEELLVPIRRRSAVRHNVVRRRVVMTEPVECPRRYGDAFEAVDKPERVDDVVVRAGIDNLPILDNPTDRRVDTGSTVVLVLKREGFNEGNGDDRVEIEDTGSHPGRRITSVGTHAPVRANRRRQGVIVAWIRTTRRPIFIIAGRVVYGRIQINRREMLERVGRGWRFGGEERGAHEHADPGHGCEMRWSPLGRRYENVVSRQVVPSRVSRRCVAL